MRAPSILLLVIALAVPQIASGLEANLAKSDPGTTQTLSVPAGNPLQVKIVNKLPGADYSPSLVIRNVAVPELPTITGLAVPASGKASNLDEKCKDLKDLRAATKEAAVPGLITALEKAIRDHKQQCSEAKDEAAKVIAKTKIAFDETFHLQPGQELVLTLERKAGNPNGVKKAVWTFVWTTGPRGEWHASYGFGFFKADDEKFFTRPGEEDGTFVIHQEADRHDLAFAPAVFFTWARESKKSEDWDYGPAGGLGFDLSKPVVFAGWQWTYNQNYTLNLGLVVRPETRLDGQYEVGQVLKEALTPDKLEDDSSYGVAGFIGVSFRFGKNPFKTSGGDGK